MNLILFDKDECEGKELVLTGTRASHIVKILKSKVGDTLKIGEINGEIGQGQIIEIRNKKPFKITLEVQLVEKKKTSPQIDLVLALPRPIMLRRILSQVTALGIRNIHLINANRVEKSFWEASMRCCEPRWMRFRICPMPR